jgi:signal transduction histidine kinase
MRSLRSRLILSHLLPILVLIPVIGVALIYLLETQFLLANYARELARQAVLVADIAGNYTEIWFDPERAQAFVRTVSPRVTAKVMLLDPTGRLLVSSDPNDSQFIGQVFAEENIRKLLEGDGEPQVSYRASEISDVVVPVVTSGNRLLGFVRLVNPLASAYERSETLRQVTLWVMAGGLLLGVILAVVLATDLEKPLRRVTQAVLRLGEGNAARSPARRDGAGEENSPVQASLHNSQIAGELPLAEEGPEEVRLLARAVNGLVERLQSLEESRRRLLANLVHELGTPLGALRSAIQALHGGADQDPELRAELLEGMDSEVGRLKNLLEELAHLHDQVLGSLELNIQTVNLAEWLPVTVGTWREAAQDKHLAWRVDVPSDLPAVQADPNRLAQALGNLISNAIRYTPEGGRIAIRAWLDEAAVPDGARLAISVEDSGPGLHAEDQARIFTPFYRGRAARRFSEGMGLGLTIARDLVAAHGGELKVDSRPGQGSRFTILLLSP